MNNDMIKKIIKASNLPCPEFTFENPLLDRNVTLALARSFVQMLKISEHSSKYNNNLRLSILQNIRKTCLIVEPDSHIDMDEDLMMHLSEAYESKLKFAENSDANTKVVDEFLIRNFRNLNINSRSSTPLTPDVLKALINLNENGEFLNKICKEVIHWSSDNHRTMHIVKELWAYGGLPEHVAVRVKLEIEQNLLVICQSILCDSELIIKDLFTTKKDLKHLVVNSGSSYECFQICISILHHLFVMTNFAPRIQLFVQMFVKCVKENCSMFSMLYPPRITYLVCSLDIDLDLIPVPEKDSYIRDAIKNLFELENKNESDFMMLLCHFPEWFDLYYAKRDDADYFIDYTGII